MGKITHGKSRSPEFRVWTDMRRRCSVPTRPDYKNYGARGITVCDGWNASFELFFSDMGERPDSSHTLERKDNEGPYCKENCLWVHRKAQERNKRSNHFIIVGGQRMTIAEAAERHKIKYYTLYSRIHLRGWSADRAVSDPVDHKHASRLTALTDDSISSTATTSLKKHSRRRPTCV